MTRLSCILVAAAAVSAVPAQNVFQGNGVPSAYVQNTPGVLGQQLVLAFGSPTTPLPLAIVGVSDGIGPVFVPHPLLGNIGLDLFSPAYQALTFPLDPNGDGAVLLSLPPGFPLASDPPLFLHAATFEATGLSISKTVRVEWANPDGWEPVAALGTARQLHTATALGSGPLDNVTEVLICGGATGSFIVPTPMASAELYSPLTRTTSALPALSLPRASHRAARLPDGRVLVTGGVTTGGIVTATCEFFDPQTLTFVPAPAMLAPRAGHALTLLDDGRVLATGGVADWQNAGVNFIAALNTAQNSAEVFDPVAGTWSALPPMASPRLGHSHTVLLDGRVLVVSGISGGYSGALGGLGSGQVPFYTGTCETFDPATDTFTSVAPLQHLDPGAPPFFPSFNYIGRAFHGAVLLPTGDVLVTGGFVAQQPTGQTNDETIVCGFGDVWQASTDTWNVVASLPTGAAFGAALPFRGGALVCGGFSGPLTQLATTPLLALHDGVTVTPLANLGVDGASGVAAPRGGHSMTALYDGTFLVYGGGVWPTTIGTGFVYTPQ
ncbi:MAG: Kelch repeat-containing protein [Planctomycetota bacterium]